MTLKWWIDTVRKRIAIKARTRTRIPTWLSVTIVTQRKFRMVHQIPHPEAILGLETREIKLQEAIRHLLRVTKERLELLVTTWSLRLLWNTLWIPIIVVLNNRGAKMAQRFQRVLVKRISSEILPRPRRLTSKMWRAGIILIIRKTSHRAARITWLQTPY